MSPHTQRQKRHGLALFICIGSLWALPPHLLAQDGPDEIETELERLRTVEELNDMRSEAEGKFKAEHRAFLERELPEAIERLRRYNQLASEPAAEAEAVHRHLELQLELAQLAHELSNAKRFNPGIYETMKAYHRLELKSYTLAERYHKTEDEKERGQIEKSLRENLQEGFRLSQEMREIEAREVEKEVKRIWALLKKRQENRDAIVERRFSELTLGADPFEW